MFGLGWKIMAKGSNSDFILQGWKEESENIRLWYCNPHSIKIGGALNWTIWRLLSLIHDHIFAKIKFARRTKFSKKKKWHTV